MEMKIKMMMMMMMIPPGHMAVFAYTYVSKTTCHTVVSYSFLDALIM
jgi:hypothetical protein